MFSLYKFRSMTNERGADGELLPKEQRLTKFGRRLRSTSLDELPELFNIFLGDMSIVGPRPLWANYLEHYNAFEHSRHLVLPGLTGLAQVSGRNAAPWARRFELDAEYVEKVSLALDIKILFMTVKKVLFRDGIEFPEKYQTIMEYFETH